MQTIPFLPSIEFNGRIYEVTATAENTIVDYSLQDPRRCLSIVMQAFDKATKPKIGFAAEWPVADFSLITIINNCGFIERLEPSQDFKNFIGGNNSLTNRSSLNQVP